MPFTSWFDAALKPLWYSHEPRNETRFRLDGMAVTAHLLFDIESPQCSCYVNEKRPLRHMDTRADSAARTVSEMIPLIRIVDIDVVSCWERVAKKTFRAKLFGLWIPLRIVLDGPTTW